MIIIKLSSNLKENIEMLHTLLPIGKSFDIVARRLLLGDTPAYWLGINGMYDAEIMQHILADLQDPIRIENQTIENIAYYIEKSISFSQVQISNDLDSIIKTIVSGPSVMFIEGFAVAIIIDLRKYPIRSIDEPDTEKVMQGSKDGFVETMLFNTNLIRRRIRSSQLTFELKTVGTDSKTDVVLAYINGVTDNDLISRANEKLSQIDVSALTMGTQSLKELLVKKRWFNPLPSIQTTERPDVACSYLMEGNILIIVDNSPVVIILPCTIFQFTQSPEDYYKSPAVGNYYRIARFLCSVVSLYLLPVFLLIAGYMPVLTEKLKLMEKSDIGPIKLLFFVIFAEFGLDILKYASSHSITALSSPLSIVGGLIVSEIAIQLNWMSLEIIFYAALTLLTSMAVSSIDLSDGIKIYRMFLILTTGIFGIPGFIIGNIIVLISVITTPTFANKSYFWPIFPFNKKALGTIILRRPTSKSQPSNVWSRRKEKP